MLVWIFFCFVCSIVFHFFFRRRVSAIIFSSIATSCGYHGYFLFREGVLDEYYLVSAFLVFIASCALSTIIGIPFFYIRRKEYHSEKNCRTSKTKLKTVWKIVGACFIIALLSIVLNISGVVVGKTGYAKKTLAGMKNSLDLFLHNNRLKCPRFEELPESSWGYPQARKSDPWGHEYLIKCSDGNSRGMVFSVGKDGVENTLDDVFPDEGK